MILLGFLWEFIRLTGLFGLLHSLHPRSPVHSSLITQPLPCLMTTCTCRVLVEQLWICQAPWHLLALTRLASLFPRTLGGFKCSGTLPSFRNFLEALEVIEPKLGGPVWEFGLQKQVQMRDNLCKMCWTRRLCQCWNVQHCASEMFSSFQDEFLVQDSPCLLVEIPGLSNPENWMHEATSN